MRKEKVTPKGSPAPVKPMNRGMDEQEQKGVTVPRRAETRIGSQTVEAPKYPFAALRRKITLNVRNNKNKCAQQQTYLYHIVKKEKSAGCRPNGWKHPTPEQSGVRL